MSKPLVIYPPYYPIIPENEPVIFLAGPIQGASLWQAEAINLIQKASAEKGIPIHIACPRKMGGEWDTASLKSYSATVETGHGPFAQYDWETHHLRRAGRLGVVMFWMAAEAHHTCERSYGQTTRLEFGEWKVLHKYEGAQLVIGIEAGWTGERYIRHRMSQDCPDIHIRSKLTSTVRTAVRAAITAYKKVNSPAEADTSVEVQ